MTPTLQRLAAAHALLPVRRTERLVLRPISIAATSAMARNVLESKSSGGGMTGAWDRIAHGPVARSGKG